MPDDDQRTDVHFSAPQRRNDIGEDRWAWALHARADNPSAMTNKRRGVPHVV